MTLNWIFFIAFIGVTAVVGINASRKIETAEDYMVANRSLGPLAIACTMIATWLGTGSLIGFVGTGWSFGITVVSYCLASTIAALTIRALWCKWLRDKGFTTMPDWMAYIYGKDKWINAFTSFCYIFMYCSWTVAMSNGCGTMSANLLGISRELGAIICGVIFTVFTISGGMKAVAKMDVFQQFVMGIGMLALLVGVGIKTGGFAGVTPSNLGKEFFNFSLPSPLWVVSICLTYFLGNLFGQHYYQRIYASKDLKTARFGLAAGAIAVFFVGIFCMLVGLSVRAAGLTVDAPDNTVFVAIEIWLPKFMGPVYLIAILAAAFSTADSALNAASTNISHDIYKSIINPDATDKQMLNVAKIATAVLGFICVLMAVRPVDMLVTIFKGAQVSLVGGIGWPIILGMYWKKATKTAALFTIPIGAITGILFEFHPYLKTLVGGGAIPGFVVGFLIMFFVSLATCSKGSCGDAFHRSEVVVKEDLA